MATGYEKFFLNSLASVVLVDCVEMSHPDFSKTHRVVRNVTTGASVRHDGEKRLYDYYPLEITWDGQTEDLEFAFSIKFGDLEGALQKEMELLAAADGFLTKPRFNFRQYRSDDFSEPIRTMFLFINELAFNREGAEFDATASQQNIRATGRLYDLATFPQLEGSL